MSSTVLGAIIQGAATLLAPLVGNAATLRNDQPAGSPYFPAPYYVQPVYYVPQTYEIYEEYTEVHTYYSNGFYYQASYTRSYRRIISY
jgi:hypothetical protein